MNLTDAEAVQIRAILALQKQGWGESEICQALKLSRRTLYRRMAKERVMRRKGRRPEAVLPPLPVAC